MCRPVLFAGCRANGRCGAAVVRNEWVAIVRRAGLAAGADGAAVAAAHESARQTVVVEALTW